MSKKSNTPIVVTPDVLSQMADRLLNELKSGRPTTKLGLLNIIAASIAGPKRNHGYLKAADKPVYANGIDLDAVKGILFESLSAIASEAPDDKQERFSTDDQLNEDYLLVMKGLKKSHLGILVTSGVHGQRPKDEEDWLEVNVIMDLLKSAPERVSQERIEWLYEHLSYVPMLTAIDTPEEYDECLKTRIAFLHLTDSAHPDAEFRRKIRERCILFAQDAFDILFKNDNHFKESRKSEIIEAEYHKMTERAAKKYLLESPVVLGQIEDHGPEIVSLDIYDNTSMFHLEILEEVFRLVDRSSHENDSGPPAA